MSITVYDYAEHIGEALAWTSPSKGWSPSRKGSNQRSEPLGGQLLYTHLKQAAMFGGDSNSRWYTPPPHSCQGMQALPKAYILAAQTRLLYAGLTGCISCGERLQAKCHILQSPSSSAAAQQAASCGGCPAAQQSKGDL